MTEFAPDGMSPEETLAYNAELARQTKMLGAGGIASALTNIAPDPSLPGATSLVPFAGAAERLLSFAGSVGDMASKPIDAIASALHLPVHTPPAPDFIKNAGQHAEDVTKGIYNAVPGAPPVDPNNPTDVANYSLGTGLGAMAPLAPASALSGLPSTISKALGWILPTTEGATVKTALGATQGAIGGALDASDTADAVAANQPQTPPAQPQQPVQEASLISKSLTDATPQVTIPAQATPAGGGGSLIGDALSMKPSVLPAPTFSEEGESGTSVGRMLLNYGLLIGAVAAGVFTHRLGSDVTAAGRDARMSDPAYAKAAADYNNARTAQTTSGEISSGISPADQAKAPMPTSNPVQAATTKVRSALLDANAGPTEYINLHTDNPSDAARLVAEYGLTHNNSAWDTRINEFNKTGRDFVTGQTIPAPILHDQDVAALSTADKKIYQDTRAARNELNNRANNVNTGATNVRHDFPQYDDAQLQAIAARGMNDPVVSELVNRADTIMNGMIRIGNARGFFSDTEMRNILATHPNYLAEVGLDGKIMHPMGPRNADPYTGISQVNTPAWSADAQHIEALYRQFELNETARMMVDKQLQTQRMYPNSAQFIEKVNIPPVTAQPGLYQGGGARDPMITVRRSGGADRYRVDNPDFLAMARGNNANQQRILMNGMGTARRVVSQMTTGAGAVFSGRAFPLTHLPRVMAQAQINLPRNRVASLSDYAVRKMTGGRVSQRVIPDPSFLLGAAYSSARSGADDLALQLSHWLRPEANNIANKFLRATITPAQVDTISQRLADYYHGTTTHEMAALGVSGAGNVMTSQTPAYMAADGAKVRLAANSQVPELFMVNGALGGTRPYVIKLRQALQQILTDTNDSGNQFIYRLNKAYDPTGNTKVLGRDVRQMLGDPGEMGGSAAIQQTSNLLPYFNVSMQGTRATARAFSNAPVATSMSYVGALGSLAALSILTAMRSKDHVNHLENVLNTQQRSANPTFYTDPDPSKNIQISLPQEFMRAGYGVMLDLMSKAINTTAALHHEGVAADIDTWLKDFLSQHVENSTLDSMMHGVTDMTNFADVPNVVNAFIAATGNTLHVSDWSKIYNDIQTHQFGFNTFVQPVGGTHVLPNTAVGDSILDGENGKRLDTILSNVFGLFGGALDKMANVHKYYNQTGDFWKSLGYAGRDWLQGMRDVNPEMNTILWENQARASVRPPIVDDVENSLRSMKTTQGGTNAQLLTDTTRKNGLPVADTGAGTKIPTDPVMQDMWFRTSQAYKFIEGQLMPHIKDIEAQIGSVSNQAMDPIARRQWMDARIRDKADAYRLVKSYVDDLNASLSAQVGRHVNVQRIDWEGNVDQFPK